MLISACASTQSSQSIEAPEQLSKRETPLPSFPKQENLIEFYVSELTSNRFFIDALSLSVGPEGVVYYTLVVKTSGGATNISFEGIRCSTAESGVFATGHSDGTWAKSRSEDWRLIENKPVNRHHAALNRDYFCPMGQPLVNAAEGLDALRRGRHPGVRWTTQ